MEAGMAGGSCAERGGIGTKAAGSRRDIYVGDSSTARRRSLGLRRSRRITSLQRSSSGVRLPQNSSVRSSSLGPRVAELNAYFIPNRPHGFR
jgi:hypothetical protein